MLKKIFTIFSFSTAGQVVSILLSPLLTRLYVPEDFGAFSLFIATAAMFSIVAGLRYDAAIVLPKSDDDAIALIIFCSLFSTLMSFLCLAVVILFRVFPGLDLFHGFKALAPFLPLYIWIVFQVQLMNQWLNRKQHYRKLGISSFSTSLLTGGINIILGYYLFHAKGLVISACVAYGIIFCCFLPEYLRIFRRLWMARDSFYQRIRRVLKEYSEFPRINAPQGFLDTLHNSLFLYMTSTFFGNVTLGYLALARRIISTPIKPVVDSVSQVLFQETARRFNEGEDISPLIKKISKLGTLAAAIGILTSFLIAPPLFVWVFGEAWYEAGVVAQIISPWVFMAAVSAVLGYLPLIVKEQKTDVLLVVLLNVGTLLIIGAGGYFSLNEYTTLASVSAYQFIFHLLCVFWSIHISHKRMHHV